MNLVRKEIIIAIAIAVVSLFVFATLFRDSKSTDIPGTLKEPRTEEIARITNSVVDSPTPSKPRPKPDSDADAPPEESPLSKFPKTYTPEGQKAFKQLSAAQILEYQEIYKANRGDFDIAGPMITGLVLIGDQASVDLLIESLVNDFKGRDLTWKEEAYLETTGRALGLLASDSDSAWKFLLGGVTSEFWSAQVQNQEGDDAGTPNIVFNGQMAACIYGLALSGRPEVPGLLMKMRNLPPAFTKAAYDIMTDARGEYEQIRNCSSEAERMEYLGKGDFGKFREWAGTPEGAEWLAWSLRIETGRGTPRK